jgi:hypothetical protein
MLHETSFQEITQENGELKVLKEKKSHQNRIKYPVKLSLKSNREIKMRKKMKWIQVTKITNHWRTLPLTIHKHKVL